MPCLFGHKWEGCKCRKCNAIRDSYHNYEYMPRQWKMKCAGCGAIIELPADFRTLERMWTSDVRQPNGSGDIYQSREQVASLAPLFTEEMIVSIILSKTFHCAAFINQHSLTEKIPADRYMKIVLADPSKLQYASPKVFEGCTDVPYLIHCLNHADEPGIIAAVLTRLMSLKANKAITECLCQMLQSGLHKFNYDNYVGGRLLRIIKVLDEASLADVIDFAIKNGIRYRDGLLLAAKRSKNTAVINQYALYAGDSGIDTELVEMITDQAILATVVCSHTFPNSDKAYEKITEQSALTYIAMHDTHYHWFADAVKRLTSTDSIVKIMTGQTNMDDVQIEAHSPYSRLRWYVLLSVLDVDERDTSFVRELLDEQDYKGIYEFIETKCKSFSHHRDGR